MAAQDRRRPPELVAASERPIRLNGSRATVTTRMGSGARSRNLLDAAGETAVARGGRDHRAFLNVEDIRALQNSGVVYGVYLNLPQRVTERVRDLHHVGNVTAFGIEGMNSMDAAHDHVPGMRHTFDITRRLRVLRRTGQVRRGGQLEVTFLPELPVPPPGYQGDVDAVLDEILEGARSAPLTVGRVSVFVD